jgi:type II secretion system protein N
MTVGGHFQVKKILYVLIAIPVIFWGIWLVFPKTSIQSIIDDSISDEKLRLEIQGLKKGLFYNLSVDSLTLKTSGEDLISLYNIYARINPMSLILLRLNLFFDGGIGEGNISGRMNLAKNKMQIEIDVKGAGINAIPLFKIAGVQGTGTISGKFSIIDGTGHVEFFTEDASFEPAIFPGITVPLNFFHNVRGSFDIKGNIINVVSVALEGKNIYARLKGIIKDGFMDLDMELMPGISFIENPLFRSGFERYEISPGYYVIPVKGELQF